VVNECYGDVLPIMAAPWMFAAPFIGSSWAITSNKNIRTDTAQNLNRASVYKKGEEPFEDCLW
jgi:hypothetical protein